MSENPDWDYSKRPVHEIDSLRSEVAQLKLKNEAMTNALNKIHDLAGQVMGPDSHPNLGAIQAWVHEVSPCEVKRVDARSKCDHAWVVDTERGPGSFCLKCNQAWLPS